MVEPVSLDPGFVETVTVDKWHPAVEQPYPYAEGYRWGGAFIVCPIEPIPTPPEVVTVDKWHPAIEQPYPYPAVFFWGGEMIVAPVLVQVNQVPLDAWAQPVQQPFPYEQVYHYPGNEIYFTCPTSVEPAEETGVMVIIDLVEEDLR